MAEADDAAWLITVTLVATIRPRIRSTAVFAVIVVVAADDAGVAISGREWSLLCQWQDL